jgi:mTERF domain-containing protein
LHRSDSVEVEKQRDNLNRVQVHREYIYQTIKKKIRASSYEFGLQNPNSFFSRFDSDRNGALNIFEFHKIIREIGIRENTLSREEINIILEEINSTGHVNIKEFMDWLDLKSNTRSLGQIQLNSAFESESVRDKTQAWTYGESIVELPASQTPIPNFGNREETAERRVQYGAKAVCVEYPTTTERLILYVSSLVDSPPERSSAVTYFLNNDIGLSGDKVTGIALKVPEVFSMDIRTQLQPVLNDFLNLGIPISKFARMIATFPAILTMSKVKRDRVVNILEDLGVPIASIGKCLCAHPQVLCLSVEDKILPAARFLVSESGIPRPQLGKLIAAAPSILSCSIENNLRPKLRFLESELSLSNSKVGHMLQKFPQLLSLSLQNNIQPTIRFLSEDLGLSPADIARMVSQHPQLLGLSVAGNLRPKVRFFVADVGLALPDLARAVAAFPALLTLSESANLRPKLAFLTGPAGFALAEVARAPRLLAYGLESRIRPRCELARRAGLAMRLASLLSPSDATFAARYGGFFRTSEGASAG